jgi:hypothetical protein
MNSNYLFPMVCKRIGWALFVPFAIMGVILLIDDMLLPALPCKVIALFNGPELSTESDVGLSPAFQFITNNMIDELIVWGLTIAMALIAFSRESDEDEYVEHLRSKSLVWSLKFNMVLLLVATLFLYGANFVTFNWIYLFGIPLLYIIRFEYELYHFRHVNDDE